MQAQCNTQNECQSAAMVQGLCSVWLMYAAYVSFRGKIPPILSASEVPIHPALVQTEQNRISEVSVAVTPMCCAPIHLCQVGAVSREDAKKSWTSPAPFKMNGRVQHLVNQFRRVEQTLLLYAPVHDVTEQFPRKPMVRRWYSNNSEQAEVPLTAESYFVGYWGISKFWPACFTDRC